MDKKEIQLGRGLPSQGVAVTKEPETIEERVKMLEERFHAMTIAFHATRNMLAKKEAENNIVEEVFGGQPKNRDGIPLNTTLMGVTKGITYILIVNDLGEYIVGNSKYPSLSAAAEAVSGTRRSGWTFWYANDGRPAKEAFGKR